MCKTTNTTPATTVERFPAHAARIVSLMGMRDGKKKRKKIKRMAKRKFNGIVEFIKCFDTVEKCMEYFESIRWQQGRYCPRCRLSETTKTEIKYEYHCKVCNDTFTVITDTLFDGGRTTLTDRITAMYLENSCIGGITGGEAETQLPVCRKIASKLIQDIRRFAFNQAYWAKRFKVSYAGKQRKFAIDAIVVDGVDSGRHDCDKRSYDGGRYRVIVFTIIEIGGEGLAVSFVVDGENRESILHLILEYIPAGSIIYSDENAAYSILKEIGYEHETVNHKLKQFAKGDATTNLVECWHAFFSAGLGKFRNSISPLYAFLMVDAAIFRFNTRHLNESEKLDIAVENIFTVFGNEAERAAVENYHEAMSELRKKKDNDARERRNEVERKKKEEQEKKQLAELAKANTVFITVPCSPNVAISIKPVAVVKKAKKKPVTVVEPTAKPSKKDNNIPVTVKKVKVKVKAPASIVKNTPRANTALQPKPKKSKKSGKAKTTAKPTRLNKKKPVKKTQAPRKRINAKSKRVTNRKVHAK